MKEKEWKLLKRGDLVNHKLYGVCEVVDFINWHHEIPEPVIMPKTDEGKAKLTHEGIPILEPNKRMIKKINLIEKENEK